MSQKGMGEMKALFVVFLIMLACCFSSAVVATTYYVNGTNGLNGFDGLAPVWDGTHGPKRTIQAGINAATHGDTVELADGTYKGFGNRDIDTNGKAITLTSANGAESTIIDCEGSDVDPHRGIYIHLGERQDTVIDGLTIKNGYFVAGGASGIYVYNSGPTIVNCIFTGNRGGIGLDRSDAKIEGCLFFGNTGSGVDFSRNPTGTMSNCTIIDNVGCGVSVYYCSPSIENCLIAHNIDDVGNGGGIACGAPGTPRFIDCVIYDNHAEGDGGGIYCHNLSAALVNCVVAGNTAGGRGGGIFNVYTIVGCTVVGNIAAGDGGGIFGGNVTITNSTIADNSTGGQGGGIWGHDGWPIATNSIIWNNSPDEVYAPEPPTFNYCDIQGGWAGPGGNNIDVDPQFVSPGYWDGGAWVEGDYRLEYDSPCIDVGDNNVTTLPDTDLDGKTRIMFGKTSLTVDMGAYEFGFEIMNIVRLENGDIEIEWNRLSGDSYEVETSTDIFSSTMAWTVETIVVADSHKSLLYTETHTPTSGQKYYRIKNTETDQYSVNTVGLHWIPLQHGRNLITSPLVPVDTSLDVLIGNQLTGNAVKFFSDDIESWDKASEQQGRFPVHRAYYDPTLEKWCDFETGGAPVFGLEADKAYWVNIRDWNPANSLCLVGQVAKEPREIPVDPIRNMSGLCYPADGVALDDCGLIDSGYIGFSNKYWSDTIEWWNPATLKYDMVYYDPDVSQWKDWDTEAPTARTFRLGEGFWLVRMSYNDPYTWTVPVPYTWPGD